ncbi:LUC7-domain-containing protein [Serendipita vermifera]|nr:LUC7-domain-containing protein [Serendipita vermifera]
MMGPEAMGITNAHLEWWDEKVCRNFLCGTCPHTLFTNTKMDLGACPKSHTDRLKTEFVAAKEKNPSDPRFAQFQAEYEQNIFAFVDECDRRIKAAHRRLEKTPEENAKTTNLMKEIGELELAIQGGTEKIEQLGEQGLVEESMNELRAVEALKVEKGDKERELQNLTETSGASGHQKLRVCDVCGAYLSVLDSDRRLADHFGGKMHLGYHELRRMLQVFKEEKEKRRNVPPVPGFNQGGLRQTHTQYSQPINCNLGGPPPPSFTPASGVPGAPTGPSGSRGDGSRGDRDRDHRSSRDDHHRSSDHHRSEHRDRGDRDRDRYGSSRGYE